VHRVGACNDVRVTQVCTQLHSEYKHCMLSLFVWLENVSELQGCPRFSHLTLTGGAIGSGPPLAVGAAIACPDRPVINIQVLTKPSQM